MNTKDYFKDIYNDFFGVESFKKSEESLDNINLEDKSSQDVMKDLFDRIDQLYITDSSKELLKKIIEYMRKYYEKIELNYIPFNLIVELNNDETRVKIENILLEAAKYFDYLNTFTNKNISLYQLENNLDLDLDNVDFLSITDIRGFNFEDEKEKIKFFYKLEEFLRNNEKIFTIITGTNEELCKFFLGREELKNMYFDFLIIGQNPDNQDIYQTILKKVELNDELKVELLDYINKTYSIECDYINYKNDLINYISFNKEVPKLEKNKSLEEVFGELNDLVGLDKVKKVLYELLDVITLKEKAKDTLNIKNLNLHMVFLGNPGTGKTTIARIIVDILYNLGYIKENKLIEVSSKDLVAEFVGQTVPKVMQVVEKSLGGVLFIDEAYTLAVNNNGNSYNAEAIATLIQAMENNRDKFVVIFAGYTKEMQDFLNSNSGITSRIGYTLEFDDYTTDELIKIFLGMMTKSGFIVMDEAIKYVEEIIDKYRNVKNFGNARFVRNIYEKTIVKHASNVRDKKQKDVLRTITREDISIENLIVE